ncbi:MAG: hypothetical protein HOV81_32990 [Kofleriaceae bacterium]|nr:hypothetical protein [Kofleriaceae bacterium]
MRLRALATLLAIAATGCAQRTQPYRFSSPMLGLADLPPAPLPGQRGPDSGPSRPSSGPRTANPVVASRPVGGWQVDAQAGTIRSVSARGIEMHTPVASAAAADAIASEATSRSVVWSQLPGPHRGPVATQPPREPADLRALVGTRDKRDSFVVVTDWLSQLDRHVGGSDGASLVAWAESAGALRAPTDVALPGDLLVFDHVDGGDRFDRVALVLARDGRGVTEFLYLGNGVVRRGFMDPARANMRRDGDGSVLNTFMRHGRRWPPKGTRYLAGELVSHVVKTR